MVAQRFENAAHHAVASGVYLDADLLLVGGRGVLDGVCMYLSIFERDTFCDLLQVRCGDVLVCLYVVNLLLQEFWVRQF